MGRPILGRREHLKELGGKQSLDADVLEGEAGWVRALLREQESQGAGEKPLGPKQQSGRAEGLPRLTGLQKPAYKLDKACSGL